MQERHQASEWVMWSSKYCSLGLHLDSPAPEIKLFFPTVTVQPSVSMYVCIYLCRETWLKYHFLIGLQPNRGGYSELFQLFLKLKPEKHERIPPPPSLVVVDAHVWAQSNHLVLECKFLKLPFHMSKKKSLNVDSLTCLLVASHVSLRIIYCVLEEERKVVFSPQ